MGEPLFATTITTIVEGDRVEENRSRFAAFGGPSPTEADIQHLIEELARRYRLARHHTSAGRRASGLPTAGCPS
jgi:putative IMPACT (imprinted ancient) family translation regulator